MLGFLQHPLTRGLAVDDPRTTVLRRRIIREKPFLRRIYEEWYGMLARALPGGGGRVLELGSGAGFFKEFVPEAIASEVFACPGIDLVLDGQRLPLADGSLRAIVMTDVLHHIPDVRRFFASAARAVRPGGVVAMIEPWHTPFSRAVYQRLHPEPFVPSAAEWRIPSSGPLSGANGALPWILFERDRRAFEREFPMWRIETVRPFMPFRYMVCGGVSMRALMPGLAFGWWRGLEAALTPLRELLSMFAFVVLRRR